VKRLVARGAIAFRIEKQDLVNEVKDVGPPLASWDEFLDLIGEDPSPSASSPKTKTRSAISANYSFSTRAASFGSKESQKPIRPRPKA
jgi:hypothetical protein